jgi:hypothetical protein
MWAMAQVPRVTEEENRILQGIKTSTITNSKSLE